MRSKTAHPVLVWGSLILLSWPSLAWSQEASPPPPIQDDPLVVKPTTTEEKFNAVLLMLKIARPDLARYYLEQTLADEPSEDVLLTLRQKHGMATFLQLTALEALNPPATQLLDRVNQAVKARIAEPGYADELLQQLVGSPRERAQALKQLQHLGSDAVPPILKNIADQTGPGSEVLTVTLTRLGNAAVAPLIGALTSPNADVRAVAAHVLGQIGSPEDAIWLWAPAFLEGEPTGSQVAAREALARIKFGSEKAVGRLTSDGVGRRLLGVATQHLNGKYKWPEIYDDLTEIPVWVWDDAAGTVVEKPAPRSLASIFFAERLAREASMLAPELQQGPIILMTSLLARAVEQNQWQTPLPSGIDSPFDLAVSLGPDLNEQVLQYSLDQKISSAALSSLLVLSRNGSAQLLTNTAPHGAVLAALNSPDQRVQFAAATTILSWEPTSNFRGSRRVVEILARALNSESAAASVVMDPNEIRANETASIFTELGFRASPIPTGMGGFQIAAEKGNIELAVLHPNVIHWNLSQTIANLRADARTASIPVIIYGPASIHDQFDRISHEFTNVTYIDEANVPVDLVKHLQPILAMQNPPQLTSQQRQDQMREASFWLRRIAIRHVPHIFDLTLAEGAISHALTEPNLTEDSLVSLGAIGTVSAQQTLFATATAPGLPPETRALAASQLAFHIQQFGQLVSADDLKSLQSIFEQEADPNIRLALASVIGTLKPKPEAVRKQLLEIPASKSPLPEPAAGTADQ